MELKLRIPTFLEREATLVQWYLLRPTSRAMSPTHLIFRAVSNLPVQTDAVRLRSDCNYCCLLLFTDRTVPWRHNIQRHRRAFRFGCRRTRSLSHASVLFVQSRGSRSPVTGPASDRSPDRSAGGGYAFIDSSFPRRPGDIARLSSLIFPPTGTSLELLKECDLLPFRTNKGRSYQGPMSTVCLPFLLVL
jgi:hypothetical protein